MEWFSIVCVSNYRKKLSAEKFQILMHLKALRSLAEPGEGVGLLAAQVTQGRIIF